MHRKHLSSRTGTKRQAGPLPAAKAAAPDTTGATRQAGRASGSVIRMRTPRSRSEDQRANLRRSYEALLRKLRAGDGASSTHQSWPVRPYAASV